MLLTTLASQSTEVPAGLHRQEKIKKWYIFKVADLISFIEANLGKPDITIKSNIDIKSFKDKKGLIVFNVGWDDATGHATLWNGTGCSDSCYFQQASEAMLWELK